MQIREISLYLHSSKNLEMANQIKGKISQIIGTVIDVHFSDAAELPSIYDALEITKTDGNKIILDCLLYTSRCV